MRKLAAFVSKCVSLSGASCFNAVTLNNTNKPKKNQQQQPKRGEKKHAYKSSQSELFFLNLDMKRTELLFIVRTNQLPYSVLPSLISVYLIMTNTFSR